jgi:hypothetical protein
MAVNRRRNPFTGVEMPAPIAGESHTVPSYSPYWVWLREIPESGSVTVHDAGTTTDITDTGASGCTFVDEDNANLNYSGNAHLLTGRSGAGIFGRARSLVHFDLSGIPAGTVVSALLRLRLEDTTGYGQYPNQRPIGVHEITESWDDDTVTWNNQPAHNPVAHAVTYTTSTNWYEWDVTALVQGWQADPTTDHGLMLKDGDEASATDVRRWFVSSSGATYLPTLRVLTSAGTYTVVAATVTPGSGECALAEDVGCLGFHESAAGATVEVSYSGTGSPVRAEDVSGLLSLVGTGSDGTLDVASGTTTLPAGVYSYSSLRVASGATLTSSGVGPLIIGVIGDALIEGTINLDGKGYAGGATAAIGLPGRGFAGTGGQGGMAGGGGGGGSSTEGTDGTGGSGGERYFSAGSAPWPYLPPSPGGGGGGGGYSGMSAGGAGGAGGGALLLQVLGTLQVTSGATMTACGAAGANGSGGYSGGGGGGGTFWLRGSVLEVDATPVVTGGAGGTSGGGAGADGFSVVEGL